MLPWQEELIAWLEEEDQDGTYLSIERSDHEPSRKWRIGIFRQTETETIDEGSAEATIEQAWRYLDYKRKRNS